jgi:Utp25, U3 small nucleolar RNA-associated SSU processome protein 25
MTHKLFMFFLLQGCLRLKKNWGDGCISQVVNSVKQVFQLIRAPSFEAQEESRFQYFKESVLNQVLRLSQPHTLIVTPSYLSFIRVRNELIRREVPTCSTDAVCSGSVSEIWGLETLRLQFILTKSQCGEEALKS